MWSGFDVKQGFCLVWSLQNGGKHIGDPEARGVFRVGKMQSLKSCEGRPVWSSDLAFAFLLAESHPRSWRWESLASFQVLPSTAVSSRVIVLGYLVLFSFKNNHFHLHEQPVETWGFR